MKKVLIISAVAALALVSCAKVTDQYVGAPESHEIAFQAISQPSTKAAIQSAVFPTSNTMEIAAYQSAPTPGSNYFTKMTFVKDDAVWTGGESPMYWPLSPATLNFFAISAASVAASNITIANDLSTASVTYATDSQSDIMYAFNRGSVTQAGNILHFNGDTPVGMVFYHALALINFQIRAGDVASRAIAIKKIELNGASYTGTLGFTNTNAAASSGVFSTKLDWTSVSAASDGVQVPNIGNTTTPVALETTYVPANTTSEDSEGNAWAALMVVPSDQTGETPTQRGFTSFTITYTFNSKEYTYTYAPAGWVDDDSDAATPDVASLTAVQAGKKYTYQITMTLHEITVAPSVTQWDEQNAANNVAI